MQDWEAFLDKFLYDTELPVPANAGSVSRDAALEWADGQYDAFAARRRLEAESEAETRYVEDLRISGRVLDQERKKTPPKQQEAKVKKKGGKT
ncbi:conserved hypothetical protein [uncultured Desulfatiglans sp.]|nr:conserved hypothetical protein [uncultured Desulfatiglans sp.]